MNAYQLIPFMTGSAYDYADGEIWPELKYHTWDMWLTRAAMKLSRGERVHRRVTGKVWPRIAPTMIGEARAKNIVDSVMSLGELGVRGALVDCGVWRGGSTMLMAACDSYRQIYCCDTFDGFDETDALLEGVPNPKALKVRLHEVLENFNKYGVSTDFVTCMKGKVQDTLRRVEAPVALLRIDVDMACPTLSCLEQIYPKMSKGGIVIVDDYGCKAYQCRSAVDSFRKINKITSPIQWIDEDGIWWRKE